MESSLRIHLRNCWHFFEYKNNEGQRIVKIWQSARFEPKVSELKKTLPYYFFIQFSRNIKKGSGYYSIKTRWCHKVRIKLNINYMYKRYLVFKWFKNYFGALNFDCSLVSVPVWICRGANKLLWKSMQKWVQGLTQLWQQEL